MKRKKKKKWWKGMLYAAGIIVLLSFVIHYIDERGGAKEEINRALAVSYQKTEEEKDVRKDYAPALIESMITDRVTHNIIDSSKDEVTVEITAPNMYEIFYNLIDENKVVTDPAAEIGWIESYVKSVLEEGQYNMTTKTVTVQVEKEDGRIEIVPEDAYVDAVYGGMISCYHQILNSRGAEAYDANDMETGTFAGSENRQIQSISSGENDQQKDDVVKIVSCINNMSDMTSLRVFPFQNDGMLYITASDAAKLSGYELVYSGIECRFQRAGKEVVSAQTLDFRDERWVLLEDTLERLETNVISVSGGLVIRGKETTVEELFALTDAVMVENRAMYQVTDTYGFAGNIGYIAANIYNIVSQGNLFGRLTGNYSEELYESIFAGMSDTVATEGILSIVSDANGLINKLDKIADIDLIGTDESQDLMELLAEGAVSDSTVVIKTLKKSTNPVKEIFKKLGSGDAQLSAYLELKGLDAGSQIGLYRYVESLVNCSQTYANMIAYTYSEYMIDEREDYYLPYTALEPVNDLKEFYYSEDYADLLLQYVAAEQEMIAEDTIESVLDEWTINMIFEKMLSSSAAQAVPLAQWITRTTFDIVFDDVSSKMDYIEISRCISELQNGVLRLYREYRSSSETAINAKYAAMLYLSLYQYNHQMAVSSGVLEHTSAVSGICNDYLQALSAVSDRDLTCMVSNEKLQADAWFQHEREVQDDQNYQEEQEDVEVPEDSSFYELSTQDKIWKCANLLEKILYRNSEIYSVRILSEGNAYMETAALMWNLYGNNNGELLSVNDSWISEYDVVLKTSSSADTVYFEIVPMVEFGRFEGETYWYDGLNWMYDWEGNLIDSGVNYGLEEGIMYALRENGYSY